MHNSKIKSTFEHFHYFQTSTEFWTHCFRSVFHFFCFAAGLVYSFAQPFFLNVDVWVFIYSFSGLALVLDAVVFILNKNFKKWWFVYAFDALFTALLIYQTGHTFFAFLYLVWLGQILCAGLQFQFKGALLQGFWISCLMAWVVLLSPYFKSFNITSFFINNMSLIVAALLSGWVSYYLNTKNILSRLGFFKYARPGAENLENQDRSWISSLRSAGGDSARSIQDLTLSLKKIENVFQAPALEDKQRACLFHKEAERFVHLAQDFAEAAAPAEKKKLININQLMSRVSMEVQSVIEEIQIQRDFQSQTGVFGEEARLGRAFLSFICQCAGVFFDSRKGCFHFSAYDEGEWTAVRLEWPLKKNENSFPVIFDCIFKNEALPADKGFAVHKEQLVNTALAFKKILRDHEGEIRTKTTEKQWSVTALFPSYRGRGRFIS